MEINEKFGVLADDARIKRTIEALGKNRVNASVVSSGAEAKQALFKILPEKAEVMTFTSMTLTSIGAEEEILKSGRYMLVRDQINALDKKKDRVKMRQLGAAPDWAVGSVHAVTEDGKIFFASASGSQLPAYAYGAGHVIWIVGAQKLVKDSHEARARLYEYCLPLEDQRAQKAYGVGSSVNKILEIDRESSADRLNMIIVKEKLGF